VRCRGEQDFAFAEGLEYQLEVALLEIAQAAMDQAAGP
jgi:hypothetical protein